MSPRWTLTKDSRTGTYHALKRIPLKDQSLDYIRDGAGRVKYRREKRSLETTDLREAKYKLKDLNVIEYAADLGLRPKPATKQAETTPAIFSSALASYISWSKENHRPANYKILCYLSARWLKPLAAIPLQDITSSQVSTFLSAIPTGSANRRNLASIISGTLRLAQESGLLAQRPAIPRPKRTQSDKPIFSTTEVARLIAAAHSLGKPQELFIRLGTQAGLRPQEILSLRSQDIQSGMILVRPHKGDGFTPKNGEAGDIEAHEEILRLIEGMNTGPAGHYFPSPKDPTQYIRDYRHQWRKILETAEVAAEGRTPHSMRHTFATNLAIAGATPYELMQALRHKSMQMAMVYIRRAGMSQRGQLVRRLSYNPIDIK